MLMQWITYLVLACHPVSELPIMQAQSSQNTTSFFHIILSSSSSLSSFSFFISHKCHLTKSSFSKYQNSTKFTFAFYFEFRVQLRLKIWKIKNFKSKVYVKFSRPEAVGLSVNKNGMGDSKYNKLMAELKASVECPVCLNVPTDGSHMLTCPSLSFCFLLISTCLCFILWIFSLCMYWRINRVFFKLFRPKNAESARP